MQRMTQDADVTVTSNAYQEFLNFLKNHSKEEATVLLQLGFQDIETCKKILDDPSFNMDEFRHLLATETSLNGNVINMFDYTFTLKSVIEQKQPTLLVQMANDIYDRLKAGQDDSTLAAFNRRKLQQNHFDTLTAKLCQLIINEKIESLNESENKQEIELLTRLNQIIDLAVNCISIPTDSQEYGKEGEKENEFVIRRVPEMAPQYYDHNAQLCYAQELSLKEQQLQEERDIRKATLLSLGIEEDEEKIQETSPSDPRDKGKEKIKSNYDPFEDFELAAALKLSLESSRPESASLENANTETMDEGEGKGLEQIASELEAIESDTLAPEIKIVEVKKPDVKAHTIETKKAETNLDQQKIIEFYNEMEAKALAKKQGAQSLSTLTLFTPAPASDKSPTPLSFDSFEYPDDFESDNESEEFDSDDNVSDEEMPNQSPRLR